MKNETSEEIFETLGQYLKKKRTEQQLELSTVADNTKISLKILRAIETDDSHNLPAPGFTRGFYKLYAEYLGIDKNVIIERFDREILKIQAQKKKKAPQMQRQHSKEEVAALAAPPEKGKWSIMGLYIILLIAFAAFLCWHLSWNPATFLSEQLRSLQQIKQPISSQIKDALRNDTNENTSSTLEKSNDDPLHAPKYSLTIEFLADTHITTVVDQATSEDGVYSKGSTRSWYGSNSIFLILPAEADVRIFFNGIHITSLPEPVNGQIQLHFPK